MRGDFIFVNNRLNMGVRMALKRLLKALELSEFIFASHLHIQSHNLTHTTDGCLQKEKVSRSLDSASSTYPPRLSADHKNAVTISSSLSIVLTSP